MSIQDHLVWLDSLMILGELGPAKSEAADLLAVYPDFAEVAGWLGMVQLLEQYPRYLETIRTAIFVYRSAQKCYVENGHCH